MNNGGPLRCFYCLDDKVSIGVCLACRTKLERAEGENRRLRRALDLSRREFWKLLKETQRRR